MVVLRFVCHYEGGRTDFVINNFSSTLFITVTVTSQLSVQEGHERDLKCAKAVDLTVGDHFVYFRLND